jgi:hypothetical protein
MQKVLSVWSESQIFRPREVYGCRLKPFSLGHFLLLTYAESPFILGGKAIEQQDLFLLIALCRRDFENGFEFLHREDWSEEQNDFCAAVEESATTFEDAVKFLTDYIDEAVKQPETVTDADGEPGRTGAPWVQTMKVSLMKNLHLTESEVMNRWLQRNIYDWFSIMEMNDPKKFRLKNEGDFEMEELPLMSEDEMKKQFEAMQKGSDRGK